MNFDPTEEQRLLAASIARFVERDYTFERRRSIVASPDGASLDAWRAMASLGLMALPLPADCEGFGGGAVDASSVMDAIGEALIVEPWLATVVAARLVARGGSATQRQQLLPGVAAGTRRMAFAHAEADARHDPASVATRATRHADGSFTLTGTKRAIAGASLADTLIVSARTTGDSVSLDGIGLFAVDRAASGVTMRALRMLDGTRAADVMLDNVRVTADYVIGDPGDAFPAIEDALDFATALVCAEAVGAIRSANDATLDYLKTRKQFGVPIGTFQALQHRMVDLAIELEQAKSMASLACAAVDGEGDRVQRARVVSAAKVRIADACRRVSQESIQLHGGIGMSDELKISHTFRRLTAIAQQFGDADHHLARFAALTP